MYILLPCVAIGGLYFTVRNRGMQFTKFGYALKHTIGRVFTRRTAGEGSVTPFQALTTALAATVGTGNIIGTSQAIAMGGYGAIFWLWIAALLGMIIKYSEVTLAVHYRERNEKGDWVGGPPSAPSSGNDPRVSAKMIYPLRDNFFYPLAIG